MRKSVRNGAVTVLAFSVTLCAADPFAGTWKSNPDKTSYTKGQGPKEQIVTLTESGDDFEVTVEATTPDGDVVTSRYTVPKQSGDGKVIESTTYDAVRAKRLGDRERQVQYLKEGEVVADIHVEVSADGKTLTAHVKGTDPAGEPFEGTMVYDRR